MTSLTDLLDQDDLLGRDLTTPATPATASSSPVHSHPVTPEPMATGGHSFDADEAHTASPPDPYITLLFAADFLDDIERVRISTENRLRSLVQVKNLSEEDPEVVRWNGHLDILRSMEHTAALELRKALRDHPLGPWVKNTVGVGEKQGARLLAAIGDPAIASVITEEGEVKTWERTVSELWAYCGYKPGQRRKKGVKSNWNAQAKMRAYLVAESCMKQRSSPYREVYDDARANWADREGVTDGHAHAHALRRVAKAMLKDLWREGRRVHGLPTSPEKFKTGAGT